MWNETVNGCLVKKTCTSKKRGEDGCYITQILDNGKSGCITKLNFEKQNCMENWEIATEVESSGSCCPKYNCSKCQSLLFKCRLGSV